MPTHGALETSPRESADATLTHGSARSLLITVLGELVWRAGQPVWTSTLVHIFHGLGIEEQTARQAIARASASGWITPERHGREVRWTLTDKLVHIFETGSRRVYSLSDPFTSWDGTWLALWAVIPQALRRARRPLYAGLTWAGFGNPAPGLWLTPHVERSGEVGRLLEQLELTEHTFAFTGNVEGIGIPQDKIVERGWDLATLRSRYEKVWQAMDALHPATPDETLFTHIRLISEWQEFPRVDPQLPEAILPDWAGRRVARRIEALRARWTPIVTRRFAELNTP
ncbi:PaaX family transcriptional regulator C-terminal domain-containing protein [Amycolatopsis sp.]|uniref:PaaX family transcriptional regulator n=1 Tax=Amycolatopsis sp. TaxID=37632 RepID=UPI002CB3061B|nr:PaaX family transcriptional regulator C-terminal domain-containing protein [Amycolatopsis sp.]HVV11273.1 PaaX family transcriptional regulator C-terminal domain-containing protein [Amycolatopsis sp.]